MSVSGPIGRTPRQVAGPGVDDADLDTAIQAADPEAERSAIASVEQWRAQRDQAGADRALEARGLDVSEMGMEAYAGDPMSR